VKKEFLAGLSGGAERKTGRKTWWMAEAREQGRWFYLQIISRLIYLVSLSVAKDIYICNN
jgi:hypothetical protein